MIALILALLIGLFAFALLRAFDAGGHDDDDDHRPGGPRRVRIRIQDNRRGPR
jgi:hypothetical protein